MEKRKGKSRKPLGKLNAKPSITVDNLTQVVSKQKAAQLPGVLKDLYGSTVSKIEFYHDSGTIKKLVDGYVAKLNEYYAKDNKPQPAKVSKPAIQIRKTEPKKAEVKTKQATKPVHAKKPVARKQQPEVSLVAQVSPEVRFIKRYVLMDGKRKTRKQLLAFINSLQRAIEKKQIRKTSKYAKEIMHIQNELLAIHNNADIGEAFTFRLDKTDNSVLEKYRKIAGSQKQRASVRLISRYVGIHGKTAVKEKAERLLTAVKTAFRKHQVPAGDPYVSEVKKVQQNLEHYLKAKEAKLTINKVDLKGLQGIAGVKKSETQKITPYIAKKIMRDNSSEYLEWEDGTPIKEKELLDFIILKYPDGTFSLTLPNEDFYIENINLKGLQGIAGVKKSETQKITPYIAKKIMRDNSSEYLEWEDGTPIKEKELLDFIILKYPDGTFSLTLPNEDFYIENINLKGLQGIAGIGNGEEKTLDNEKKEIKDRFNKIIKLDYKIIALAREAINNRDKFPLITDFDLLAPLSRKELANSKYRKNFYKKYNDLYNERKKYLIKMGEFSLKAEEYFISLKNPLSDEENDFLQKVLFGNRQDWFNENSKLGLIKHNHPIKKGDKVLSPFGKRGTVEKVSDGVAYLKEFPGETFKTEFLKLENGEKKVAKQVNRRKKMQYHGDFSGPITAKQLADIDYETFGFTGKWKSLIGNPAKPFTLMFWSKPGMGKSSLAIKLSKYMASDFGQKILFVAAEEGLSYTLLEKFTRLKASNDNIFIVQKLPDDLGPYDVIVLDSITRMKMIPDDFLELKEKYPDKSYILVFQATVDGSYRGSKEWEHEVDVSIFINDNGYAKVSKGRFGGDGTLKVFSGTPEHIYRFTLLQDAEKFVANRKDEKLRMVEGDDGKIWVTNEDKAKDLKKSGYVIL